MDTRRCFCGCIENNSLVQLGIAHLKNSPITKSNILSIVKCINPRCGFIFNNETSSQEEFNAYYTMNDMYFYKKPSEISDITLQTFQTISTYINKDSKIIDIGCGYGELLLYLKQNGYTNIHGLDTSQLCIDNLVSQDVKMYTGDIFKNSIDQTFDLVILSHVIEHIYDLNAIPPIISKLLAPDGVLYVEVPDSDSYYNSEYQLPFQEYNTEHINHFNELSLEQLFMNFKLVTLSKKIVNPHSYESIYGIFTHRIMRDPCQTLYIEKSKLNFKKHVMSNISIWCIGEFAYKLIYEIGESNIINLIDDNKCGKQVGNKKIISGQEFDFRSDIIIASLLVHKTKLFFHVFDLDGTLIDSDKIHYNALVKSGWTISFEEYEHLLNTTGIKLDFEMQKIKDSNMDYDSVQFIKGAEEFIDYICKNNLNHAIVTNSRKSTVDKFKEKLPALQKLTNWITREDYTNPKPSPDGYKLAVEKYYKNEKHILGFENTVPGYQSIKNITDIIFIVSPNDQLISTDKTVRYISDYNCITKIRSS